MAIQGNKPMKDLTNSDLIDVLSHGGLNSLSTQSVAAVGELRVMNKTLERIAKALEAIAPKKP